MFRSISLIALSAALALCTAAAEPGSQNDPTVPMSQQIAEKDYRSMLDEADQPGARLDYTKRQLHALQLGLMRWSVDSPVQPPRHGSSFAGFFPDSLTQLVLHSYCGPGFYPNAYDQNGTVSFNAANVPFGWSESAPGNFTYLKHYNAEGMVDDHVLIAYGPDPDGGLDIDGDGRTDGAIITLASTNWMHAPDAPARVTREFWTEHGQRVMLTQDNRRNAPAVDSR